MDFNKGDFGVQVGAFKEQSNALRLQEKLLKEYSGVRILERERSGETFFLVRLTQCKQLDEALRLQKLLEEKGYTQTFVVAE